MIKEIFNNGILLGIIVTSDYKKKGVHFFTPDEFSQQLGYMNHVKGTIIEPHLHNVVRREVQYTQEVLIIKSGKLRVDFYDNNKEYLESHILNAGDIILLSSGGHGFEAIEDMEMIEVKQGPYAGDKDKTRFEGIAANQIKLID